MLQLGAPADYSHRMAKRGAAIADYDSPWKVALHKYFNWFLAFFFPDIHADIDWARGYEALDKEFQQVVRDAQVGKQVADMLFKVWVKDGEECWLFIHVEIQGSYEKEFARRMFDYNTAVYKLYNREVVSLAVLCDERASWRPTGFSYGRWTSRTGITFPAVKLLDYAADLESLEKNNNPFAVVVMAHLQAQATRGDARERRASKLRLVKGLYERKLTKDDIRELFRLLDWILILPDDLQEQFREEVYQYEKEKRMPYLSSLERRGLEEGLKRGRDEGRKEGRKEGHQEGRKEGHKEGHEAGRVEGLREGLAAALETKFGQPGRKLMSRVRQISDVAELRELFKIINTASTVEDVRRHLS